MDWLGPVAVAIIVPLVLGALKKGSQVAPQERDGRRWVEYGWGAKGFAMVGFLIVMGLAVLFFFVNEEGKEPVFWMAAGFAALVLPLFIEFFFVKLGYNDETLLCYSPWRSNRTVRFEDMEKPVFSESMQWWEMPTKSQGKVRVSTMARGAKKLVEEVNRILGVNTQTQDNNDAPTTGGQD